jgi:hypothetical protein
LIDIVKNWRILIKCNFYRYFVYSDPNFFRIEEFGMFIFVFLLLVWAFFGSIPIPFRLSLTEFLLFYNLHIGGIFSLFLTIFFQIYYKFKSRKKFPDAKLESIFEDEILFKIFSNYANKGTFKFTKFRMVNLDLFKKIGLLRTFYANQTSKNTNISQHRARGESLLNSFVLSI